MQAAYIFHRKRQLQIVYIILINTLKVKYIIVGIIVLHVSMNYLVIYGTKLFGHQTGSICEKHKYTTEIPAIYCNESEYEL